MALGHIAVRDASQQLAGDAAQLDDLAAGQTREQPTVQALVVGRLCLTQTLPPGVGDADLHSPRVVFRGRPSDQAAALQLGDEPRNAALAQRRLGDELPDPQMASGGEHRQVQQHLELPQRKTVFGAELAVEHTVELLGRSEQPEERPSMAGRRVRQPALGLHERRPGFGVNRIGQVGHPQKLALVCLRMH